MQRVFRVNGHCPACGHGSLRLDAGTVVCVAPSCPLPDAVDRLLRDDTDTAHTVVVDDLRWFALRHPLVERITVPDLGCDAHRWLAAHPVPDVPTGKYRLVQHGDDWAYEEEVRW